MAFEPVKMTDPSGKRDDVVAETAIDYNNFRFRDGYVPVPDPVVTSESDADSVQEQPPAKPETATERRKREQREAEAAAKAPVVGDGTTVL
ncbi:hypothetical protein SEA_MACGULLY_45 [Rhodococcus phage MacGully]|nr:hypothetical protein SEA_MACGULLY_45 [Rhodococcus phage MacGully]